jgi:hypothetical protein
MWWCRRHIPYLPAHGVHCLLAMLAESLIHEARTAVLVWHGKLLRKAHLRNSLAESTRSALAQSAIDAPAARRSEVVFVSGLKR